MPSLFRRKEPFLDAPGFDGFDVTPDNSNDLAITARGLWVGDAGDVEVDTEGGTTLIFGNVQGLLPQRVKRVRAANTTAGRIIGII